MIPDRRKPGRPTKRSPAIVSALCQHISDGVPFAYSAALVGISHETFHSWQRKFPDFREAVQLARARGVASRLALIKKAMRTGDVRAAQWWLEHCEPEFFSKSRIQVEAVATLEHSFVIPRETLDQIAEARARHDHKQLENSGA